MLTLQFVPYHELENLSQNQRISKLLRSVREDKIVLVEGKLNPEEEALLIQKTMEEISRSFKGVEICSIDNSVNAALQRPEKTEESHRSKIIISTISTFIIVTGLLQEYEGWIKSSKVLALTMGVQLP